jgi:hypothetical protein
MLNRLNEVSVDAILRDGTAPVLHRDYETRSTIRLNSVGAYRYAADPHTEVLCCAYAVDDQPVQLWLPGDPVPPAFVEAAQNSSWLVAAFGDHFETAIEQYILGPRFGWPLVRSNAIVACKHYVSHTVCRRDWIWWHAH